MSDMEKNWLFACVFLAVIKPFASVNVTHVYEPLNWWQASDRCVNDGLEFRESILKRFSILKGRTFWIGKAIYSKTSDWLEIIGCYTVSNTTGMTELPKITSLGECQIKCKSYLHKLPKQLTVYFGYKETKKMCICARNIPVVKTDILDCVTKKSSSAYFFYQVYQSNLAAGQGEHCTTLECLEGHTNLKAVNCLTTNAAGRCVNEDTVTPPWGKTFIKNLDSCKLKNQLLLPPSTYCNTKEHKHQGILSWTNVFRKVYESELTEGEGGNEIPLKCIAGQLMYLNGKWDLITTENDCSIGLNWFLCRKAEAPSSTAPSAVYFTSKSLMTFPKSSGTTSSPAETRSSMTPSGIYVPSKSLMTFPKSQVLTNRTSITKSKTTPFTVTQIKDTEMNTSPSPLNRTQTYIDRSTRKTERIAYVTHSSTSPGLTKDIKQTKHQKDQSEQGGNPKTIGAIIGGLLGSCSVIALLAALIICKVRSIGVFKQSSKHHKQETSQMQFSKTTYQNSNNTTDKRSSTPTSNETYGLAEYSTSVYAVVNKIKTPEYINDTYTDAGYGEYDHLHDIQNRKMCPQNEEDQTYDSSDFGKGKCNDGNGLYDQSFSVVEGEYSYLTNKNHDNSNSMGIYDKEY